MNTPPLCISLAVIACLMPVLSGCGDRATKKEATVNEPAPTNPPVASTPSEPTEVTGVEHLNRVPPPVQRTTKAQIPKGKITNVHKVTEDGETTFEVQIAQTVTRTLKVDADGTLAGFQVFEAELPVAVQKVLRANLGNAKLRQIYRETEDEDVFYTTDVVVGGNTNTLSISDDGDWWSLDITTEQAPAPVQQTVKRLWGSLEITDVSKTSEDGEVGYEFEGEKDGRQHSLTIAPDGSLVAREDELELSLVPAVVQSKVKNQIGTGELIRIARATNEVGVSFEVEAQKGGKSLEFRVDPAGKLIEDEN